MKGQADTDYQCSDKFSSTVIFYYHNHTSTHNAVSTEDITCCIMRRDDLERRISFCHCLDRMRNKVTMWLCVVPATDCNVNQQNARQALETVEVNYVRISGTFNNRCAVLKGSYRSVRRHSPRLPN